jgi:hypothetical protein
VTLFEERHLTPSGELKLSTFNIGGSPSHQAFCQSGCARPFLATMEHCLMGTEKKKVTREFRVTVTVEEIDAPKVADMPAEEPFSDEAAEFVDESDYSTAR